MEPESFWSVCEATQVGLNCVKSGSDVVRCSKRLIDPGSCGLKCPGSTIHRGVHPLTFASTRVHVNARAALPRRRGPGPGRVRHSERHGRPGAWDDQTQGGIHLECTKVSIHPISLGSLIWFLYSCRSIIFFLSLSLYLFFVSGTYGLQTVMTRVEGTRDKTSCLPPPQFGMP